MNDVTNDLSGEGNDKQETNVTVNVNLYFWPMYFFPFWFWPTTPKE